MKQIILYIYLIIQTFLYLISVFIDTKIPTNITSYLIIVINFLFSLYLLIKIKNKDSKLTTLALLFTLIADTFLVLLGTHLLIAMISFSVTQIFYMLKVKNLNNTSNEITKFDLIRTVTTLFIILIVFITTIKNIDLLILVTSFYFVMLVFNFLESIKTTKENPLVTIGLFLFIFCDIFVGLNFLKESLPLDKLPTINFLLQIPFNFIWFFYAPSQVLLTISAKNKSL